MTFEQAKRQYERDLETVPDRYRQVILDRIEAMDCFIQGKGLSIDEFMATLGEQ